MISLHARLEYAVAAICPEIEARAKLSQAALNEERLWWELSCCVLSSQVPYDLAIAAADAIHNQRVLLQRSEDKSNLSAEIAQILWRPLFVNGASRHYRFPNSKADQLASTRISVTQTSGDLCSLLTELQTASAAREWLVSNAAGCGPKQASMFLRNSGVSYDLAILDRHVLNYMRLTGLQARDDPSISTLSRYRKYETKLRTHAAKLGFAVGLLDWAIWIVMRAARSASMQGTVA